MGRQDPGSGTHGTGCGCLGSIGSVPADPVPGSSVRATGPTRSPAARASGRGLGRGPATTALPRDVSLARIVAHGLVPATAAPTPTEAVRRQLGIQGQQVNAVPHALVVRTAGSTPSTAPGATAVDAAFERGELVRSWPMRGTVHITTAADHHWLRASLMHRMDSWVRASRSSFGVDDAMLDQAADLALALIAERGPLTRTELLDAWSEAGLMTHFQGVDVSSYRRRHLLVHLQRLGILVQGPRRGNEHLVTDARSLPAASTGPGGAGEGRHGTDGHRAALAEIARRYATSHGPVSVDDLARWTTLPKREAAQALEDAVELTTAADYPADPARCEVPLARAVATGGPRGSLTLRHGAGAAATRAGGTSRSGDTLLYLRADLLDLLESSRRAAAGTHFLGSFDELHVGYKDRTCLTDDAGERLICPAMNGMFRPLLVDRGRLVAVRPVGEGLIWADWATRSPARAGAGDEGASHGGPSARLERDVRRAVARVTTRLAR